MHSEFQRLMTRAAALTRSGDLKRATAALQSALAGPGEQPDRAQPTVVLPSDHAAATQTGRSSSAPEPAAHRSPVGARFIGGDYSCSAGRRDYKLYVPPQAGSKPLPLVVMLHGCTQNPDDFAAGTAMNEAAFAQGFFVLYPGQSQEANPQRCWNWFKHSHQQRGRGEPLLLSGMTQHVMATQAIDPQRVYVAGLSAGGAMAAILGNCHPELFAAVGVHSGLAAGAASDLPSALAAMRSGAPATAARRAAPPTIVFHGRADKTVHPANGEQAAMAGIDATADGGGRHADCIVTQLPGSAGRRGATRQLYQRRDGSIGAELWLIDGAPHAWAGGSAAGSYTDPQGPDATAEMLRFFFERAHH